MNAGFAEFFTYFYCKTQDIIIILLVLTIFLTEFIIF
jgi:hypothetical protein